MAKKFLCAESDGLCCEGCFEALQSGVIDGNSLSLMPEDRIITFTGHSKVRPGHMRCELCGAEGEFDVCFEFLVSTIEEIGKFGV